MSVRTHRAHHHELVYVFGEIETEITLKALLHFGGRVVGEKVQPSGGRKFVDDKLLRQCDYECADSFSISDRPSSDRYVTHVLLSFHC
jgi:hypothetical protein